MTLADLKALPTAEMQLKSMRQLLAEKTELITELTEEHNQALRVRELAREASNRDLEAKRQALAQVDLYRTQHTRIAPAIEGLCDLQRAMDAEYAAGRESLFHTWSQSLGGAIAALQVREVPPLAPVKT